jgi:signal transduction histidine kinase
MLDYTKVDLGKVAVQRDFCELKGIADTTVGHYRQRAGQKGIQLITEFNVLPSLQTDPALLRQIMENLISNAIKYTPSGGEVRVVVHQNAAKGGSPDGNQEGWQCFEVIDTGQGIPEHAMGRLFKPFGQIGNRPTAGESSTGLGLAIVKRFCDLLGARITVESKPGSGSRFCVCLPSS